MNTVTTLVEVTLRYFKNHFNNVKSRFILHVNKTEFYFFEHIFEVEETDITRIFFIDSDRA